MHYLPALILTLIPLTPSSDPSDHVITPVLDGSEEGAAARWRPVMDGVMGGLSNGVAQQETGFIRMKGAVSLENNGGFASFRWRSKRRDFSGAHGLRLTIRGDGNVFSVSLRTDDRWDGVSWRTSFTTIANEWMTVDVAFQELIPSWRGRLVGQAGTFDRKVLSEIGVFIADKQEGNYQIDLKKVETWKATKGGAGSVLASIRRSDELAKFVKLDTSVFEFLEECRWSERWVVISSPKGLTPDSSKQAGLFANEATRLAATDMRLISLIGLDAGRLAGQTLTKTQVRQMRKEWKLSNDSWSVVLVGKDGDVKARWKVPVAPAEVFALVESMPMRQRELSDRKSED